MATGYAEGSAGFSHPNLWGEPLDELDYLGSSGLVSEVLAPSSAATFLRNAKVRAVTYLARSLAAYA